MKKPTKPSLHIPEAQGAQTLMTDQIAREGNYIPKDWDHHEYDVKKKP